MAVSRLLKVTISPNQRSYSFGLCFVKFIRSALKYINYSDPFYFTPRFPGARRGVVRAPSKRAFDYFLLLFLYCNYILKTFPRLKPQVVKGYIFTYSVNMPMIFLYNFTTRMYLATILKQTIEAKIDFRQTAAQSAFVTCARFVA